MIASGWRWAAASVSVAAWISRSEAGMAPKSLMSPAASPARGRGEEGRASQEGGGLAGQYADLQATPWRQQVEQAQQPVAEEAGSPGHDYPLPVEAAGVQVAEQRLEPALDGRAGRGGSVVTWR
jgi:hypothetical protein